MSNIQFIAPDSIKTIAQAAGLDLQGFQVDICPLQVGDVITHPAPAHLAFRVAARWYRPPTASKEGLWYLRLEASPHPLDTPELGPPSP